MPTTLTKAVGPDAISTEIIKATMEVIPACVPEVLNESLIVSRLSLNREEKGGLFANQ